MNIDKIYVPKGIIYISDWGNLEGDDRYDLRDYNFPHIVNKVLTGCGFTEYCIRNDQDIILLSPRRFLLENKFKQHKNEENVMYAENKSEISVNYERDISVMTSPNEKSHELEPLKKAEIIQNLKESVKEHSRNCFLKRMPCKILVTYDSFRHVKEALGDRINRFQIVVDEFQSIFIDSRFKAGTELEVVNRLKDLQRVCYVSATPMLKEYLEKLEYFKDLPYYEFDWEKLQPGRTKKPKIDVKFTKKSLTVSVNKIVQSYLNEEFETRPLELEDGKLVNLISNEAVLFFNSVKGICQTIKSNKLKLEQCNILCARNDDNEKKVRDAFNSVIKDEFKEREEAGETLPGEKPKLLKRSDNVIGNIPVKGETHKMFTFCTRTVYLGADFYSTSARTFVFSDSNIECLAVDISMDLEQILGRQRLNENPWKNTATVFIKTTKDGNKISEEEFKNHIDTKIKATESLLRIYKETGEVEDKKILASVYLDMVNSKHYNGNYVTVDLHAGSELVPCFNNLVWVSEQRAFEVQQKDYSDRFTVLNVIESRDIKSMSDYVIKFANIFNSTRNTEVKLKLLVEFSELDDLDPGDLENLFQLIPDKYKDYYVYLGPEKIRAYSYHESLIRREIDNLCSNSQIENNVKTEIYSFFEINKRYLRSEVKNTLKEIYNKLNYKKSPKALDLNIYFKIKEVKIPSSEGKYLPGIEILEKL